jgi:hypothetical protein
MVMLSIDDAVVTSVYDEVNFGRIVLSRSVLARVKASSFGVTGVHSFLVVQNLFCLAFLKLTPPSKT